MIYLSPPSISASCQDALVKYQAEVNGEADYPKQLIKAKAIWPGRKQNKPFEEVKEKLRAMSSGARRCHYCEDSYADEIEHIRPKNLFPSQTFVWENYLYACGPCNGPKGDQFSTFDPISKQAIKLLSPLSAEPSFADALLIDPRAEDPFPLIFLDLKDSFFFQPWEDNPNARDYQRAKYTIKILRLNLRDDLVQARKNAYANYRARLREYSQIRDAGATQAILDSQIQEIQTEQHPSVWQEMKGRGGRFQLPELANLFRAAPEALGW
jgi:uncharacterized protein (TIGR02646 family)